MTNTTDLELRVQTEEGTVLGIISRAALARLTGRSHVTPEEIASAYRIEREDIVRDKLRGSNRQTVRIDEGDL
jgi:hypothetical protein